METPPTVAIFRRKLLPPSEVFIREQCEALRQFRAFYVGWRRVPGLDLPPERVAILRRSLLFRLTRQGRQVDAPLRAAHARIIHAQFEEGGIEALPLARSLGIPLAVTFRGYDVTVDDAFLRPRALTRELYRQRRHRLQRSGHLFLGVSAFIRRKMIERGYPADRSIVHYNGVNLARFRPPAQPAGRRPMVLFVGRLVEKKGCEFVIRAVAELQASVPQIELVVVGDGPLRSSLETLARPLLRRVKFLSGLTSDAVRDWMEMAQIFSIGSITAANGDSEGLPNVVVEAMACGLPVVSFDHAGIGEAVLHGKTGFLAPERAWTELAKSYAMLLQNPACWEEFSRAGRRHVEATFDQAKQTPRLEAVYEELIRKGAK